jgi:hypothetical protein
MVDDGVAFCRNCNAPQIRVAGPVVETAQPVIEGELAGPAMSAAPSQPGHIEWSRALPATALGGLIASLFMVTPLGPFGLGMIVAGILSVLFYRRRNPAADLTPGMGAKLGAVSGIIGFGMFSILMAMDLLVRRSGGELRAALLQAVQQSAARSPDPQVQQVFEYFKTPAGLALIIVMGLVVTFVIFLVLSAAGGALGAVLLRRKQRT